MNEKDRTERNIALTFDFLRYLVDHPEIAEGIPDGAEIEFIGSDIVTTGHPEDPKGEEKRTLIVTKRTYEPLERTTDS